MGVKKNCVVLIYNSFEDPLFQNIMLQYMKTLVAESGWRFHLITFEQPQYAISETDRKRIHSELNNGNIVWHPRNHHTGKFLILKKAWDFASVALLLARLRIRGIKLIWSFANVAASIAWVYSKIFFFRAIIYSYEPHSQFMVELEQWSKNSMRYKLLNFLELRAGRDAEFVLTGTEHMVEELKNRGAHGEIYRAPTSVDENDFYFRPNARKVINARHGFSETDKIILYTGKFGGLYYTFQVPLFFRLCDENLSNCRFIIVSSNLQEEVMRMIEESGFDANKVLYLTHLPYEEVKVYMSSADLGISAVPPTPSQKFRSPTKVAEYLLCGLPYVTCEGVSEDDIMARKHGVGIVVKEFASESVMSAMPEIREILATEKSEMVKRCRKVGMSYRSKRNVDKILKEIFDRLSKECA